MSRKATLSFDRGTLILHPPPRGQRWAQFVTWDDRIEKFRLPAIDYRIFMEAMREEGIDIIDEAKNFASLQLKIENAKKPFSHQQEALEAWKRGGRRGVVELPTGAGKSYLAQLAIEVTPRSSLICVPTLDLMHQWYAQLEEAFPNIEVGLLGGGSKDESPILIATYDSAAIFAEKLGNRYGLLIFDECHHLPSDFKRSIAEYAIAPYRLGLSATLERTDGKEQDIFHLIGPLVYSKKPEELAGGALAEHKISQIYVELAEEERLRYEELMRLRNAFLQEKQIFLGSIKGWQLFVQASAQSKAGRKAMLAHREARKIAFGTAAKLRVLDELLQEHRHDRVLIFTDNNATVYEISQSFLIPAITHQTKVKERHQVLADFRTGDYPRIVTSRVLNEGVDVPDANVAIVLSGTSTTREYVQRLGRILRQREGKLAILYEVIAKDTSEERVSERRRGLKYQKKSEKDESSEEFSDQQELQSHYGLEPITIQEALNFDDL
ncbi:MAG: DEAD/DEAH box helicase family protein [Deinococcales bacterium]